MAQSVSFVPVLIGADMNCYSVARAFHEAYGVVSHAFGRWRMGDTMDSRIVKCTYIPDIDTPDTLVRTVTDFANAHADKTCIVMGCTDDYAGLLMEVKGRLPQNCIAPYIDANLRDKLVSKADFYKMCDKYGILMICDEVMAGFARTGRMFAWQNFDMKPDLITFAKGVTCGYVPLGGVIASRAVSEYFEHHVLQCGLTYSGHTLACAAGCASVQYYLDHDICGHVKRMEGILKPFLEKMADKHRCVGEARCIGLFAALTIVRNKETRELMAPYHATDSVMPRIMAKLKERGFSTFGRETNINICPPLIITAEQLGETLPILDEVLGWVDETFCD